MPVPLSTYRVQLTAQFGFRDVAALADYFAALGVSHIYCSPILTARPGSTHGYDVVDHSRVSAELGGEAAFREMASTLREHGIGVVVDVVPNHMAADPAHNAQWAGLLREGRESPYAQWFDVDWDAQDGRVVLPVLGEPLADAPVTRTGGVVRYYQHAFPDSPHYRLAWWRYGTEELNYRRFFDVTDLVAVRVEDEAVFAATHDVLVELVRSGVIDGLRIDHPDGLADPRGYLARLAGATGGAWVVVEKILEPGEALPADWPCAGTTGYDALRRAGGVLIDPAGEQPLTDLYASVTGEPASFEPVAAAAKGDVVTRVLAAEVNRLTELAYRIAAAEARDLSRRGLRAALEAVLASFGVYRAYLRPGEPVPPESRRRVEEAVARAHRELPGRAAELAYVQALALGERGDGAAQVEFAIRFQQTCGPVMAKGVEDTGFYRWFRLSALNEVGGDPGHFSVSVEDFHRDNAAMQDAWATSMTSLSTHDTKRSEDVRARLAVLAELPVEWGEAVVEWRARQHFRADPNTEYLFWQTLVGGWPLSVERASAYVEKAAREAKRHTSWTDPNPAYTEAFTGFIRAVFADEALVASVRGFVERIAAPAASNVLAQKLLQLAMPGVPDVYQGTELESLHLVDPDNRQPVDYERRRRLLADIAGGTPDDLDGRKLLVTARTLAARREHPAAFAAGYRPLAAEGSAAGHLVAFGRGENVIAVATRLPVGLARRGGWGDTTLALPGGGWRDAVIGEAHRGVVRLADVLATMPVALLVRS